MNLDLFISHLEKVKPSEKLLINEGFSGIHLEVIKNNYSLKSKEKPNLNENSEGEIELVNSLFNKYETKYLRFGDYSFEKEIKVEEGLNVFCSSSNTFLALSHLTKEIVEYDREEFSVINYCSRNVECFFEALLHILELNSLRLQGIVDVEDNVTNTEFLNKCVSNAGGDKYKKFYQDIIFT